MIDAKRIAEIREGAKYAMHDAELVALCDYALAAMEAENDLAVACDPLPNTSDEAQYLVVRGGALEVLARLRAARGAE